MLPEIFENPGQLSGVELFAELDDIQLHELQAEVVAAAQQDDFADHAATLSALDLLSEETDRRSQAAELAARVEAFATAEAAEVEEVVETEEVIEDAVEVEAPVAVEAAVAEPKRVNFAAATQTEETKPLPVQAEAPVAFVASANIRNIPVGTELDRDKLVDAFVQRMGSFAGRSVGDRLTVASANWQHIYPEDRRATHNDFGTKLTRLHKAALATPQGLTASGGVCGPPEPIREIFSCAGDERPLRDGLPAMQTERGEVSYLQSAQLVDVDPGVGVVTASDDAAGYTNQTPAGPTPPKDCVAVTCPTSLTAEVAGVYRHLCVGNFQAKYHPEVVDNWIDILAAQWAREGERNLYNTIRGNSNVIAATAPQGGAVTDFFTAIEALIAGMRERERAHGRRISLVVPSWLWALLRADLASRQSDPTYSISDAELAGWFETRNVGAMLEQFAAQRDYEIIDLCREEGLSGASLTKRPCLLELLDRLDAGEAEVLLVAKLDRLCRSLKDFIAVTERARANGWALIVRDPELDMSTPFGKAMAQMIAVFAELEREMIVDRVKTGMAQAKASGKHCGRKSQLGAEREELILSLYDELGSAGAVAKRLNADGVPTSQGGARWYQSTVAAVLARLDAA